MSSGPLLLAFFSSGRPHIFDFTVADSLVSKSCNEAGSAAEYAEEKKRRECNFDENFLFTPIGAETLGAEIIKQ